MSPTPEDLEAEGVHGKFLDIQLEVFLVKGNEQEMRETNKNSVTVDRNGSAYDSTVHTTWTEFLTESGTCDGTNISPLTDDQNIDNVVDFNKCFSSDLQCQRIRGELFADEVSESSQQEIPPISICVTDRSEDCGSLAFSSVSGEEDGMLSPKEQHSAPFIIRSSTFREVMQFTDSLLEGTEECGHVVSDFKESNMEDKKFAVSSMKSCGDAAFRSQDFQQAKYYYLNAFKTQESLLRYISHGNHQPTETDLIEKHVAAEIQMSLGLTYGAINKLKRAEDHFQNSLATYNEIIEKESLMGLSVKSSLKIFVSSANKIGNLYYRHRYFQTALSFYKFAMENPYFLVFTSGSNPAYQNSDESSKAVQEAWGFDNDECRLEKALLLCRADSLNNMANVYNVTGQYSKAILLYNQARQIQTAMLDEDDPIVSTTLFNVGSCYCREGKFELAIKTYKEVIDLGQRSQDGPPQRIVDAMAGIAVTLHALGETHQAIAAYSEALEVAPHCYGCKDVKTAGLHNAIGELYKEIGDNGNALSHFREAYSIYLAKRCYKKEPEMRRCRRNIKKMGLDPDRGILIPKGARINYFAISEVFQSFIGTRSTIELR